MALTTLLAVPAAIGGLALGSKSDSSDSAIAGQLVVRVGDRELGRIRTSTYLRDGVVMRSSLQRQLATVVPAQATVTQGRATIVFRYDRETILRRASALGAKGGTVDAARRPVRGRVRAPIFKQAQRNSCESAALSMLLATKGRAVDQQRLQNALPTSGPLDPSETVDGRVWGDPDIGYVGRASGGGVAGGFGVYPGPVRRTAKKYGVKLADISDASPRAVYSRLRSGRAVMVWIGLSDGPYGEWKSPAGRAIKVNFGEHTVVLHGIRKGGSLLVANPLEGTREVWAQEKFEAMWELLDRRALAT